MHSIPVFGWLWHIIVYDVYPSRTVAHKTEAHATDVFMCPLVIPNTLRLQDRHSVTALWPSAHSTKTSEDRQRPANIEIGNYFSQIERDQHKVQGAEQGQYTSIQNFYLISTIWRLSVAFSGRYMLTFDIHIVSPGRTQNNISIYPKQPIYIVRLLLSSYVVHNFYYNLLFTFYLHNL